MCQNKNTLTRRKCLWLATAVLGRRLPASFANTTLPASQPAKGMTLGFSTYGSGQMPWKQALDHIAKAGYDSVELAILPDRDTAPENLSSSQRRDLRGTLARHNLALTSLLADFKETADEKTHRDNFERLKHAMDLAHALSPNKPPLIQTVLGGGTWSNVKSKLRDRLGQWVTLAASTRTLIAIKQHRGHAMSRPDDAIWLCKQLNRSPWLRMVFDYSHFDGRNMPLEQTVRDSLPWTAHVAVKDVEFEKNGRCRFVLPGESGRIDYAKMLKLFQAGGYKGDVCVEISRMIWGQENYNAAAAMKKCYSTMNAAFSRAHVSRSQHR